VKIFFDNATTAKRLAKKIAHYVRESGKEIKLRTCQDMVAKMFGYRNFSDLYDTCGIFEKSLPDDLVALEELNRRADQYQAAIESYGFDTTEAARIIENVQVGPWLGIIDEP